MQVTENILDPQYRKRKFPPPQRHHAYVEDRLPAAYAAQGPRAMLAPTVGSTATRRSKDARNILWSASFFCSPGSAAAAACLFEDFAHSGPFHRHLRHSYAITCCRRAPPPARIRGWSMKTLKKDAIKKTEEAFKKKYSGIKANIHRTFIGKYLAFSPNTQ